MFSFIDTQNNSLPVVNKKKIFFPMSKNYYYYYYYPVRISFLRLGRIFFSLSSAFCSSPPKIIIIIMVKTISAFKKRREKMFSHANQKEIFEMVKIHQIFIYLFRRRMLSHRCYHCYQHNKGQSFFSGYWEMRYEFQNGVFFGSFVKKKFLFFIYF